MTDLSHSIEEALDICLTRISAGESAEACMRDFPQYAGDLEALLATATQLRIWIPPELSTHARTAAQTRARAALRRTHQRQTWGWGGWALLLGTATLLALALFGGGVAFAGRSLPGSPLYGLKRVGESARMVFVNDSADRALLNIALTKLRVDELIAVAKAGRGGDPQLLADLQTSYLTTAQAIARVAPENRPKLLVIYRAQVEEQRLALTQAQDPSLPDATRRALDAARRASEVSDTLLAGLGLQPMPQAAPTAAAPTAAAPTAAESPSPRPLATAPAPPAATSASTGVPAPTAHPPARPRPRPSPTVTPAPAANATAEPTAELQRDPLATPAHEGGSDANSGAMPRPTSQNPDDNPPQATQQPEPRRPEAPGPSEASPSEPQRPESPAPTEVKRSRSESPTDTPRSEQPQPSSEPGNAESPKPEHTETSSPDPEHAGTPEYSQGQATAPSP